MQRFVLTLLVLAGAGCGAPGAHLHVSVADFASVAQVRREVWLTPLAYPTNAPPNILTWDVVRRFTDSNGCFTVSNLFASTYRLSVVGSPSTNIWISFPPTNVLLEAAACVVTNAGAVEMAYTTTAADVKFATYDWSMVMSNSAVVEAVLNASNRVVAVSNSVLIEAVCDASNRVVGLSNALDASTRLQFVPNDSSWGYTIGATAADDDIARMVYSSFPGFDITLAGFGGTNESLLYLRENPLGGTYPSLLASARGTVTDANWLHDFRTSILTNTSVDPQSICAGYHAGLTAPLTYSVVLGPYAGEFATVAAQGDMVLIGPYAGQCVRTNYMTCIGYIAGYLATNAWQMDAIGQGAGAFAAEASLAQFLGNDAGAWATNASRSVFVGSAAGAHACGGTNSIGIGSLAGYLAGHDSICLGTSAGCDVSRPFSLIIDSVTASSGGTNAAFIYGEMDNRNLYVPSLILRGSNGTPATITANQAGLELKTRQSTIAAARYTLALTDTTTGYGAGVGGGIVFQGIIDGAGSLNDFGYIYGVKETAGVSDGRGKLVFGNQDWESPYRHDRMTIASSGSVGIGTNTPAALLHLRQPLGSVTPLLAIDGVSNAAPADAVNIKAWLPVAVNGTNFYLPLYK